MRLLAIEAVRDIDVMVFGQCRRGESRQRNALVGGPEQHVETHAGFCNRSRVETPQFRCRVTGVEQAGVEKVRAQPSRLEREFAEAQHAQFERQFDELPLVPTHSSGLLYDVRDVTQYDTGDNVCFA